MKSDQVFLVIIIELFFFWGGGAPIRVAGTGPVPHAPPTLGTFPPSPPSPLICSSSTPNCSRAVSSTSESCCAASTAKKQVPQISSVHNTHIWPQHSPNIKTDLFKNPQKRKNFSALLAPGKHR